MLVKCDLRVNIFTRTKSVWNVHDDDQKVNFLLVGEKELHFEQIFALRAGVKGCISSAFLGAFLHWDWLVLDSDRYMSRSASPNDSRHPSLS